MQCNWVCVGEQMGMGSPSTGFAPFLHSNYSTVITQRKVTMVCMSVSFHLAHGPFGCCCLQSTLYHVFSTYIAFQDSFSSYSPPSRTILNVPCSSGITCYGKKLCGLILWFLSLGWLVLYSMILYLITLTPYPPYLTYYSTYILTIVVLPSIVVLFSVTLYNSSRSPPHKANIPTALTLYGEDMRPNPGLVSDSSTVMGK